MADLLSDVWLEEQIQEINAIEIANAARARLECSQCPARSMNPPACSVLCRFWKYTASDAELESAKRNGSPRLLTWRTWSGPDQPPGWDLRR